MARPRKEAFITHFSPIVRLPKAILLHITHALHDEPNCKHDDARNVPTRPEAVLGVASDGGRVEQRYGQRDGPNPEHLEDPKAKEWEEAVAFVVEAVILAGAEDAEEQESREAERPGDQEEASDDLACMVMAAEGESEDGQEGEVGAPCEVYGLSARIF